MRTSDALVHVDAQPESGGPFVTASMAFATHVNLIRPERLEVAILIPVQRAFSMRCEHDQRVGLLEDGKTSRVVNCARTWNANEYAKLDHSKVPIRCVSRRQNLIREVTRL